MVVINSDTLLLYVKPPPPHPLLPLDYTYRKMDCMIFMSMALLIYKERLEAMTRPQVMHALPPTYSTVHVTIAGVRL
jgi:hypothetical protein